MRAELSTIHPTTEAAPTRRLYVGSEVGVLRRVILHRPDLELKRLTPHNKDALLFDDVLWVRRARQEHDAFADALADRGVEVLYLERLLADVLAAERRPRGGARADARRGRPRAEPDRTGPGVARERRRRRAGRPADRRHHLRRAAVPLRRPCRRRFRRWTGSSSRRCPTTCSRATRRRGSTTACRSTRWRWRRAGASRSTTTRSTATIRCSRSPATSGATSSAGRPASRAATSSSSATAACSSAWASGPGPPGSSASRRRCSAPARPAR